MNESFDAIVPVQDPPRERPRGGVLTVVTRSVLGPNEDRILPYFVPYTPSVNMLPRPKPPSWLLLGGLSLFSCALVLGLATVGLSLLNQHTDQEIQQVKQLTTVRRAQEASYKSLQSQVDAIDAQKGAFEFVAQGAPRWADILDRLRGLMPEEVRIERLEGTPDGILYLKGRAASLKAIGRFMLNLRASGFFYEPQLGMGNRGREGSDVSFDLQVKVSHGEWLLNPEYGTASRSLPLLTKKATP